MLAARSRSRKNCVVINVESLSELHIQFDLHTCIDKAHGGVLRSHTTVSRVQHSVCTHLKNQEAGRTKIMLKSAGIARLTIWLSYSLCRNLPLVLPACANIRCKHCLARLCFFTVITFFGNCAKECSRCLRLALQDICVGRNVDKRLWQATLQSVLQSSNTEHCANILDGCSQSAWPIAWAHTILYQS